VARLASVGLPLAAATRARASFTRSGTPGRARFHKPPARGGQQTPLVTTITRIVGVIPWPVWVVLGGLAALAFALAARSGLTGLRARRLERQRRQLLEDVGLLQAALLPVPPDRIGSALVSAAYRPADGPAAGGDFYDLFALEDGRLAVIVGDLSGHGRDALPHTALVRFTLRAYLEAGLSPRSALRTAATVLERQLGDQLATVLTATYDPDRQVLVYASAGHPPPIVLGAQPFEPIITCSSAAIGMGLPTGMRQTTLSLPGRSVLCFFTDGVVEARVAGGLFGADRLACTLSEAGDAFTASELLDHVAAAAQQRDDMAACLIRVQGDRSIPNTRVEQLELDRWGATTDYGRQFLVACGVDATKADEIMRAARIAGEQGGNVVLEVRLDEGPPEAVLRRHNVAALHAGAHRHANTGLVDVSAESRLADG
jgi:serine phosphatase RsbU (regulator of sigma subunit)